MKNISLNLVKNFHPNSLIQVLYSPSRGGRPQLQEPVTIEHFEEEIMGLKDWRNEKDEEMSRPTLEGMMCDGEYQVFCVIDGVIWYIDKD